MSYQLFIINYPLKLKFEKRYKTTQLNRFAIIF